MLRQNEVYRCSNDRCGCEITVTKGAGPGGGNQAPRCCCGMEMNRTERAGTTASPGP